MIPKYKKLKNSTNSEDYRQCLMLSFVSAIISPCIVVNPKTKTFLYSSLASGYAHLALLICFITYLHVFRPGISIEFFLVTYSLPGLLLISSSFSWILHAYSKPEFKCCVCCQCSSCLSQSSTDETSLEIVPRLLASNDVAQEDNIGQNAKKRISEKIRNESKKNSSEETKEVNSEDIHVIEPLLSSDK